jgi:hypothetical protein
MRKARLESKPEALMSDNPPPGRRLSTLAMTVAVVAIVLLAVAGLWLAGVLFR